LFWFNGPYNCDLVLTAIFYESHHIGNNKLYTFQPFACLSSCVCVYQIIWSFIPLVWLLLSVLLYWFVIIVFLFLGKWFLEHVFLLFVYGTCGGGDLNISTLCIKLVLLVEINIVLVYFLVLLLLLCIRIAPLLK